MDIKINMTPYKKVYEGHLSGNGFELNIFKNGDWDIDWLSEFPDDLYYDKDNIETEIYKHYLNQI